jgi:dTDP-glucose 4,6-dehydratase
MVSLPGVEGNDRYSHELFDICGSKALGKIFLNFQPTAVMHLAAESHVDRYQSEY